MSSWGIVTVVLCLGGSSFLAGMLPLSMSLSKERLAQISTVGTGLLLGTAMGVIIPEGIEAIYEATESAPKTGSSQHSSSSFAIAIPLLLGFTLMFLIEQLLEPILAARSSNLPGQKYALAPTSAGAGQAPASPLTAVSEFDADLELEIELNNLGVDTRSGGHGKNPRMLTLGLVIHSLADGLALGAANALAAAAPPAGSKPTEGGVVSNAAGLSFIVFLAIAIHKAPTALALTSTLVTQLPPRKVRHHLVAFALASPLSALVTYSALVSFGGISHIEGWTGSVLMFSGGTFLYVATVLSSLSAHSHEASIEHSGADLPRTMRVGLTVAGMFLPVILSRIVGHGH
ncbi:hypothetical protein FRB99_001184 [Tulasnella sp. 403]|nr:hypothetical protein FRB99_001184 [Tulasnella sp. 403]